MRRLATKFARTLDLIRDQGPISANALVDLTGDWRQTIDCYIREARAAGLLHIAGFGPSPFGGRRTVKLWAFGAGVDAKRPYVQPKPHRRTHTGTPKSLEQLRLIARRRAALAPVPHPLMALFGATTDAVRLSATGRVIRHLHDDEPEMERAA